MRPDQKKLTKRQEQRLLKLVSQKFAHHCCTSCGRRLASGKPCTKCAGLDPLARTLGMMGRRPGFWLRSESSLGEVEAFIVGFQHGLHHPEANPGWFTPFTRWIGAYYKVIPSPMNGFSIIRERVGGDDSLAFHEFFKLLPKYIRDMRELGPDGIDAKYLKAVRPIMEKRERHFRRKLKESQAQPAPVQQKKSKQESKRKLTANS